jgi:hypothetical protein
MAREQLNTLTYSELSALARRLTESAETVVRNPSFRADLHQAAGAVSDLASIKFGVEEIAAATHDGTTAGELLELIGREPRA